MDQHRMTTSSAKVRLLTAAVCLVASGCVGALPTAVPATGAASPTRTPGDCCTPPPETPTVAAPPTLSSGSATTAGPTGGGSFIPTGSMAAERSEATATTLPSGLVLVAGGQDRHSTALRSAELYDPAEGTFRPTGSMTSARSGQTATLLADGRVLIAGGTATGFAPVAQAEIYDPKVGTFSTAGAMVTPRLFHTATLLKNGRVLIAGGRTGDDQHVSQLSSAELFDPVTAKFSVAGSMSVAREEATATRLPDGKVLVAGGANQTGIEASAELFDVATGRFEATESMATARSGHTATLLQDGRVLIAGGEGLEGSRSLILSSCELYDPGAGTFGPTGSLAVGRSYHSALALTDGRVLVLGGSVNLLVDASQPEVYDPLTAQFQATGLIEPALGGRPAIGELTDGRVLVVGGRGADDYSTAAAELYQP